MKSCSKCKLKKQLSAYSKNRSSKDGYTGICKKCKNLYKETWYQENKDREKTSLVKRYGRLKNAAKLKGMFDITFEQYCNLINSGCHYCSVDISLDGGYNLDRIDNDKGYELSNVVPCCSTCNVCRNNKFSSEEWSIAIKAILNFRTLKL